MAPKPSLSITLPRNFTFHYADGELPKTPAPPSSEVEIEDVCEPPPPPRQTFKVRRKKAESIPRDIISDIEGDGLPTFEMTEPDALSSPESEPGMIPGYLAPAANRLPLLSPPKTPVDQMSEYTFDNKTHEWSMFRHNEDSRPQSACSTFSNSSISSAGSTSSSYDSFGANGSCTSPESDSFDPFSTHDSHHQSIRAGLPIFSPEINSMSPTAKRAKTHREAKWTAEMDNHLWMTYLRCLEDPKLTPFKMLPGTAPPLGVCGRVAREAKHSWKSPKAPMNHQQRGVMPSFDADKTIGAGSKAAKTWSHWPSTESGTRKRLRKLCKRTPSLSAHYQRLMSARTPSPFQSSSSEPPSDAQPPSYPHDMETTKTQATPMSQPQQSLAPSSHAPLPPSSGPAVEKDGWYRRIGRTQAHQKSQSLQIALGNYSNPIGLGLESPFNVSRDHDRIMEEPASQAALDSSSLRPNHAEPTSLRSPLALHAPVPTNRSLKRRFGILDQDPANVHRLENLFNSTTVDPASNRPALRDRAFSLGAVYNTTRSLSLSFERNAPSENPFEQNAPAHLPAHVHVQDTARLGSPFAAPAAHLPPQFNTFPRRFTPLGSEMPQQTFKPNLSLEGKFRQLAAQSLRQQ